MMKLSLPGVEPDLKPHIVVFGVGGAGGNAVNNMIQADSVNAQKPFAEGTTQ